MHVIKTRFLPDVASGEDRVAPSSGLLAVQSSEGTGVTRTGEDSERVAARFVIAAPRSGEGKTSLTLGLAAALRPRGLRVALAKVGPDYLDTGWHALASGAPSRNLDVWMMGEAGVLRSFEAAAREADIVLVEGVMGLFDGHRSEEVACSTADVAKLLDAPVVLAVDASRAAASLAALSLGFAAFDRDVRIAGVLLNRFRARRDRSGVAAAFERVSLPVLGWVPPLPDAVLPSRHLGLVQAGEDRDAAIAAIAALGRAVETHCDVDALVALAGSAPALPAAPPLEPFARPALTPTVAVAGDEAFAFYYPDNLEILEAAGARIEVFSPLRDEELPAGTDGVYLGGGYPELAAAALAANGSMLASIRAAARSGVPIYAECGGMLYLLESLAGADGSPHVMARVLPGRARMNDRLQRVGYVEAELASDGILGPAGTRVRGHEFRYSSCEPDAGERPAWLVGGEPRGFALENVLASYLHLDFAGCPHVATAFVEACAGHAATSNGRDS